MRSLVRKYASLPVLPATRMLAGIAAVAVLVAGCGGSQAKSVNAAKVAIAIRGSVATERHLVATVDCPAGMPDTPGTHFYCAAEIGSTTAPFQVTVGAGGKVTYKGLSEGEVPVLDAKQVAATVAKGIERRGGVPASVVCPAGIPRQRGLEFVCIADSGSSSATDFIVRVINSRGDVTYRKR